MCYTFPSKTIYIDIYIKHGSLLSCMHIETLHAQVDIIIIAQIQITLGLIIFNQNTGVKEMCKGHFMEQLR